MANKLAEYWSRRKTPRANHWLVTFTAALTLGLVAFGAFLLVHAREDTWNQARQSSENLAVSVSRDIARNIELYDLVLQGVVKAWHDPTLNEASPAIRRMAMFGRAASAEYLGSVVLTDAAGNAIADSENLHPRDFNIADREHFQALRDDPNLGLYISRPVISRLKGEPGIVIGRRVNDDQGRFAGIVAGVLRLAYFQEMFSRIDLGATGSITLFRNDGRVVARTPARPGDLDADLSKSPTFRRTEMGVSGSFTGTAALDGIERFYTYRQIGRLPLILSVNLGVDEVFRPWRLKALGIGFVLAVLCATAIASCILFQAELRRRMSAEAALRRAAERLRVMAATDSMTGLKNRRAIEEALAQEWKRGHRTGKPLSAIMLDADFFKAYNDRYGHPAGDRVLQQVARSIDRFTRRPADIGARYGGEEFILLLPETDLQGASVVGELIRADFAALNLPHEASPFGKATLSVGIASALPALSEPPDSLVQLADMALYEAKRAGRNRVVPAPDRVAGPAVSNAPCTAPVAGAG